MSTTTLAKSSNALQFNFFDPEQFATMQLIAEHFSDSELVPEMYRPNAEKNISEKKAKANCMIALSLAQRMQADPLMVMQNLIVIQGRPSWSSKFLIATVNTCGRFETLKYRQTSKGKIGVLKVPYVVWKLVPGESQKKKVTEYKEVDYGNLENLCMVAYTKEKGSNEELVSTEVSILMAIQEGWYDKNGSKWVTMPEKMLKYRAASFWTNEYAPEISMGMKTEEEVEDIIDIEHVDMSTVVSKEIEQKANKKTVVFAEENEEQVLEKEEPAQSVLQQVGQQLADEENTTTQRKANF